MKIYTSYFARIRQLPPSIVTISISLYPPKGYQGIRYTKLAPTDQILREYKAGGSIERYTAAYQRDVLSKLDPVALVANLEDYFGGKDISFVCYEKSGDFCHRHLVAEWLRAAGFPVEEWRPEDDQFSLFEGEFK